MTTFWKYLNIFIFINTCTQSQSEKVLGRETDEFDFDGLPGSQHEFKFDVAAGKQDCMYKGIPAGGSLHVSFQVLRGGDGKVALFLTSSENPMEILQKIEPNSHGAFQHGPISKRGDYAICVDNTESRMGSKLVYLFISTHVEDEWTRYAEEMKNMRLTETSIMTSLQSVQESVSGAYVYQAETRMHVVRDWYLISRNNTYIQTWSIGQCIVIVVCSGIQVYFVRRLFRGYNVNNSSKKPNA